MDKIELLKTHLKNALDVLEEIKAEERGTSILNSINSNMLKLLYSYKDAFTFKEISSRTGISVKTLYRYEKEGSLKTISKRGMKKIVTQEDLTNFLIQLKGKG